LTAGGWIKLRRPVGKQSFADRYRG
jgi:hypothetical protein